MKSIVELKKKLEQKISQKYCNVSDINNCPNKKEGCTCSVVAETQAYLRTVIPDPYYKYSIFDFNGLSDKLEQVIDSDAAIHAKKKIIEYCWKDLNLEKLNDLSASQLDHLSVMQYRRDHGTNVVIFAESDLTNSNFQKVKGKTFCAAIIMKEAIKRRASIGGLRGENYDWIEFPILDDMIKNDDERLNDVRFSDWLVIDNITRNTRQYLRHRLDPFLLERVREKLPTIFVCRFDIRKDNNELLCGMALSKIFNDPKTFFIPLHK